MISHHQAQRAAHLIDESGVVDILVTGYRTSKRGRPANRAGLRLMLIGLLLTITERGMATLTEAHRTLTTDLPLDTQIDLGVVALVDGRPVCKVSLEDFYNLGKALDRSLVYTAASAPSLGDAERQRRHDTVRSYSDALMDMFSEFAVASSTVAIDATGIWSFGRGFSNKERKAIEAAQAAAGGDLADTVGQVEKAIESMSNDRSAKRRDIDAAWGVKTAKNGKSEVFFGYHEHTMVLVANDADDADTVPPLITRFELTAANCDVVNVTLGLIDRSPAPITDIIVDRHYHYKEVDRWKRQLINRGVEQHLDLRIDEQGFLEADSLRWVAGEAHCPATPDIYGIIDKPALDATSEQWDAFHALIDKRGAYAMRPHDRGDAHGTQRLGCPALAGKVGCPLRAGTVQTAVEDQLPVIEHPPAAGGEPLPPCCTQATVRVTPPDAQLKLRQRHRWGSLSWRRTLGRRSRVEGSYGNRKNPAAENVRRGQFQKFGLVWVHIVMGLANVSYNLRMLDNWHERNPDNPFGAHPLLLAQDEADHVGYVSLSPNEYRAICDARSVAAA